MPWLPKFRVNAMEHSRRRLCVCSSVPLCVAVGWGSRWGLTSVFPATPGSPILSFMIQTNVCPFPPEITSTRDETMYGVQILCLVKNVVRGTKKAKCHSLDITVSLASQPQEIRKF